MYNGYRIKINGRIISENLISKGSYSSQRVERVLDEYVDAFGVSHETLSKHRPMRISFTIRERSIIEQKELNGIFENCENVPVEYWDDVSAEYKSGIFKMESPTFKHRNTRGHTINYAKTTINLKEY